MVELDSQEDIRHFIAANGLDVDLLDERDEALEAWRLKWEGLAEGCEIRDWWMRSMGDSSQKERRKLTRSILGKDFRSTR